VKFAKAMKGKKNRLWQHSSLEHRMNMSKAMKGKPRPNMKGKPWTQKRRDAQKIKNVA
jgi:hypothetical protein